MSIIHQEDLVHFRDILDGKHYVEDEQVIHSISNYKEYKYKKGRGLIYRESSLIFDGIPSFDKSETIMIRVVLRDGQILNILIACALFKK